MFQGLSKIKVSTKGLAFLKRFVANGSCEWQIEMPEEDYLVYKENLLYLSDKEKEDELEKGSAILVTRMYLDADLVTEMARDRISKELFIKRYPEKLEAHFLRINNDLQAFNKLIIQIKVLLLGLTSGVVFFEIGGPEVASVLILGNITSFVFPRFFSKSMVFFGKRFVKT